MIIRIKRKDLENGVMGMLVLFLIVSIFIGVSFTTSYVIGAANITNNSVLARVNITNTEPNITAVSVDDATKVPAGEIDLRANDVVKVICNATVFDYNGWQDINASLVNASFYISSVGRSGPSDGNHRYVNDSCGSCRQATSAESGNPAETAYCDCNFAVQYYANDSAEWLCNVSVTDLGGSAIPNSKIRLNASGASSTTRITKLLAINTSTLLDYGNLSVTETSSEIVHNLTNAGNINLNLTLRGYAGTNNGEDYPAGKNLTMMCDFGNISMGNQRFAAGSQKAGISFELMYNITNETIRNTNLTVPARIDDTGIGWDRNSTFWKLQVPLGVGGICNSTIIFGASDAEV